MPETDQTKENLQAEEIELPLEIIQDYFKSQDTKKTVDWLAFLGTTLFIAAVVGIVAFIMFSVSSGMVGLLTLIPFVLIPALVVSFNCIAKIIHHNHMNLNESIVELSYSNKKHMRSHYKLSKIQNKTSESTLFILRRFTNEAQLSYLFSFI